MRIFISILLNKTHLFYEGEVLYAHKEENTREEDQTYNEVGILIEV